MKVYVAMGGMDYEGFSVWTMRIFESREEAEDYAYQLITTGLIDEDSELSDVFDFSKVFEKEVE